MRKPVSKILRIIRSLLLFFFLSTLVAVVIYRFVPVYVTPLMVIRSVQQIASGDKPTCKHTWVSFNQISPHLPMAVIASEDNRFAEHNGFDFKEIEKAIKENESRKRKRGASTISQQTAKNVFLWPQSSWLRKGLEVYFTFLIETFWSKERIMEVFRFCPSVALHTKKTETDHEINESCTQVSPANYSSLNLFCL